MDMNSLGHGLGFIATQDERDKDFPLSAILPERPFINSKMWWNQGWWGDQGNSSMCVAFSWSHWLEDGPVIQTELPSNRSKPLYPPVELYKKCQRNDGMAGNNYDGTTIRAAAKILKELGIIREYRWATSIDDIITCLLTLGPMVVGTVWHQDMFKPDSNGLIKPRGRIVGGHAYLLNGIDLDKQLIRIKNSWGAAYGIDGQVFISIDDFAQILNDGGQACMALAEKVKALPNLDSIPDDDVTQP